ncbi:hypothetical protein FIBSPDRAFT_1044378 [Athelia psychrophila]|uniref:Uncharacterized protein n=1 Tax=Athelia psychrophila TaxID=1759441 RepID=A0A166JU70_9AGAM|nr:hypothetical protein FIBSPDRAFT_1044378 [Fibularhizoctonia sp. CBS 109695]
MPTFHSNAVHGGNLSDIREESTELEVFRDDNYRDLHTNSLPGDDEEFDFEDVDDDVAEWDEESTLVALLDSERDGDDVSALANNLQTPITARGVTLKEHLVHTIIPAAKKVKKTHLALDVNVDPLFEEGILLFNDASRNLENLALRDEDELRTAYKKVQTRIKNLFSQLEEACERRDKISSEFNIALEQSVHRVKDELDTLPGDIERVITSLDKKSKEMDKDGTVSAKSKEKMIRDLLANL